MTLNRQTFAWFILETQTYLKTRLGISCVMYYFKCEQNLLKNSIWTYTTTTLWAESMRNFWLKRCSSHSKVRLFTYLNNKLFLRELKILNYDGLWQNKKIPHENQRFDWKKLIHGHRLVNISWLADINLFDSMIWLV